MASSSDSATSTVSDLMVAAASAAVRHAAASFWNQSRVFFRSAGRWDRRNNIKSKMNVCTMPMLAAHLGYPISH